MVRVYSNVNFMIACSNGIACRTARWCHNTVTSNDDDVFVIQQ